MPEGPAAGTSPRVPLSAEQLVFWLASLDGATDSFLTLSLGYRLYGRLDLDAFAMAVARLQAEHDVLHSLVRHGTDGPYCVHADPPDLDYRDLRRFALSDAERRAHAISAFETARQFNLEADTFARFRLLRLRDDEYVFLATVHHIAFDADSVQILERVLSAHYADALAGRPPRPAVAGGQYCSYATRQAAAMLTPEEQAYWSGLLSQPSPPRIRWPRLPEAASGTRLRGADASAGVPDSGDASWGEMSGEAWNAAMSLVRRTGATAHIVLLASFAQACAELCGVADGQPIEVGVPTSMRWEQRWQNVIGPFIHTLPVRVAGGPAAGPIRRIAEVRATTVDMLDHLRVPLPRAAQLVRSASAVAMPRPQVAFQYLVPGKSELTLPDMEVDNYARPRRGIPPFDLSLVVYETNDMPRVRFLLDSQSGVTTHAAARLLVGLERTLMRHAAAK